MSCFTRSRSTVHVFKSYKALKVSERPKMSTQTLFLPLHRLETPKDIVTERGEAMTRTQLCHHAEFHADRWHRRDICPRTDYTNR